MEQLRRLIDRAEVWAGDRGLLATTQAQAMRQARKMGEEVEEALLALTGDSTTAIALELGDVAVTICIQARIQGISLTSAIASTPAYRDGIKAIRNRLGNTEYRQKYSSDIRHELKDCLSYLMNSIARRDIDDRSEYNREDSKAVLFGLGMMARSVMLLANQYDYTFNRCLAAALDKIEARTGETVVGADGGREFVKAS